MGSRIGVAASKKKFEGLGVCRCGLRVVICYVGSVLFIRVPY